jgi:hypothetical protein
MARLKTVIQADLDNWTAKLMAAEATLDAINATANRVNSFDDNEGRQSVTKRSLAEQTAYIEYIEDKLVKLRAELAGKGTVIRHANRRSISGGGINI